MFEGVPDQFHQFIASSRTSLPLPLSYPPLHHHHHHGSSTSTTTAITTAPFSSFDPSSQQVPAVLQPNFLHPILHHGSPPTCSKSDEKQQNDLAAMNLEIERERSIPAGGSVDSWSNDEVLALLRIRSSMENWFPEFTWEHVSRKLAELGFKRSGEKCKEKFEEESRYFNNINYNKNYRVFTEFEELYNNNDGDQNPLEVSAAAEKNKELDKLPSEEQDKVKVGEDVEEEEEEDLKVDQALGNPITNYEDNGMVKDLQKSKSKKRKRVKKFEMFKGFCEDIVRKMMAQQEKMHNKLLQDMVKRDEEKLEREEARKKAEMDKFNKKLELRAHEQALAGDRQSKIIQFLTKFTSSNGTASIEFHGEARGQDLVKVSSTSNQSTSSFQPLLQNPNSAIQPNDQSKNEPSTSSSLIALGHQKTSSLPPKKIPTVHQPPQSPTSNTLGTLALAPQNPNAPSSSFSTYKVQTKSTTVNDKDDLGKRWPRDEVLALINIRCSLYNNNELDKEGSTAKAPLWERISQGMSELGYKRSAKRCKEKWENINKYFRKTKDINKKRSMDSRTCPYFHQLSTLYNQGTLVPPSHDDHQTENRLNSPQNHLAAVPETRHSSLPQNGNSNISTMQVAEGEKNMAQVPAFEYEF